MKLRIQGNSLRLRLTQSEVERIGQQETVRESMYVGGNSLALAYCLTTHADNSLLSVTFQEHELRVSLPAAVAQQWATTDRVGIEENLPLENERFLHVLIEKDFQCLHRDESDEPDQFPNPAADEAGASPD